MKKAIVHWINRRGEPRQHTVFTDSESYARDWYRRSIEECQGVLTIDERRTSQLKFVKVELF